MSPRRFLDSRRGTLRPINLGGMGAARDVVACSRTERMTTYRAWRPRFINEDIKSLIIIEASIPRPA